jgi:hypothetical protein
MIGINLRRRALLGQEVGRGVLFGALALIEDHLHLYAAFVGIEQRFGDRRRGEAVSLDKNPGLSSTNDVDNQLGTVPPWSEAHGRPAGR